MLVIEYSEQLEIYFDKFSIKKYDFSQFEDIKVIGRGGSAIVYEATLLGKKFALKILEYNISMDRQSFEKTKREVIINN